MNWYVMRLPATGGAGVVPETALEHHIARGWIRCSDAISDGERDQLVLGDYTVDLDAKPEPPAKATAKQKEQ